MLRRWVREVLEVLEVCLRCEEISRDGGCEGWWMGVMRRLAGMARVGGLRRLARLEKWRRCSLAGWGRAARWWGWGDEKVVEMKRMGG
jgi:hypothetical protein